MMAITVKDLRYNLFLTNRQHLTVFIYQLVLKILSLDDKLIYFTPNCLLPLIVMYI